MGESRGAGREADEFVGCLRRLRAEQGVSVRALSIRTGIPASTLGGYFTGRHLPATRESLATLLNALDVPADEHGPWTAAAQDLLSARRSGHVD